MYSNCKRRRFPWIWNLPLWYVLSWILTSNRRRFSASERNGDGIILQCRRSNQKGNSVSSIMWMVHIVLCWQQSMRIVYLHLGSLAFFSSKWLPLPASLSSQCQFLSFLRPSQVVGCENFWKWNHSTCKLQLLPLWLKICNRPWLLLLLLLCPSLTIIITINFI